VLSITVVFREGGVMCCELFQSVHRITVGFVHCCFSPCAPHHCSLFWFRLTTLLHWVTVLVSLFQSVNICYVFCVVGTRYSLCSLCRCNVVSFHVVYFVLFVSVAFICLEVWSVLGWKASGVTSQKGAWFVG